MNHHPTFTAKILAKAITPLSSLLYWLLLFAVLAALTIYMQHYIDFTDQGSYLQHYMEPQRLTFAAFSYYFYVASLFQLLDQHLYHFRLAGLALLLLASLPLAMTMLSKIMPDLPKRLFLPVYLLGVASFYRTFVIVPGYKWFLLIATMLFLTGMVRLLSNQERRNLLVSGFFIGLGGWMAFLAKPPSGALLALIFLAVCTARLSFKRHMLHQWVAVLAASGSVVLFGALFHFMCFESLNESIKRLAGGLEIATLMGAGHVSADQLIQTIEGAWQLGFLFIYCGIACIVCMLVMQRISPLKRLITRWPLLAPAALMAAVLVSIASVRVFPSLFAPALGLKEFVFIFCLYATLLCSKFFTANGLKLYHRDALVMAGVIFFASIAYRAGSNIDYFYLMNFMGVFYCLMALLFCRAFLPSAPFVKVSTFVILPFMALLYSKAWESYNFPYASDVPVYKHTSKTQLTSDPSNILYLDPLSHNYIETVRSALAAHQFQNNQIIIDMTGVTPLITYIAQSRMTPAAWIVGQAKGASGATLHMLKTLPKSVLQQAWLLMPAHDTPREYDLDPAILAQLGLHFPADYEKVAQMQRPYPLGDVHALWKPAAFMPQIHSQDKE